jgi:hypothetical protein
VCRPWQASWVPSGLVGRVDGCEGQGFVTGIGCIIVAGCSVLSGSIPWILQTTRCELPGAAASTTPMATTITTTPVATAVVG